MYVESICLLLARMDISASGERYNVEHFLGKSGYYFKVTCLLWARADIRGECRARANQTRSSLLTLYLSPDVFCSLEGVLNSFDHVHWYVFHTGDRPLLVLTTEPNINRAVLVAERDTARARLSRRVCP